MSRGAKICFQYKKRLVIYAVVLLLLIPEGLVLAEDTRPLCCNGKDYPSSSVALYYQIEALAKSSSTLSISGEAFALIVPNDSYLFTGHLLADAYTVLSSQQIDRIVLFGYDPSADPVNIYIGPDLSTPIGIQPLDNDLGERLLETSRIQLDKSLSDAHLPRSLEIQLPFISYFFGKRPVLPIGLSSLSPEEAADLGRELAAINGENRTLFIAVSNLSRAFDIGTCESVDNTFICAFEAFKPERLIAGFADGSLVSESPSAIIAAVNAASECGADCGKVLRYENTGMKTGDHQKVCGYLTAVAFRKSEEDFPPSAFSDEGGKYLLALARSEIETELGLYGAIPQRPEDIEKMPFDGVHLKIYMDGKERGGLGSIFPQKPVSRAVKNVAVSSAFYDPRYNPITPDEIGSIKLKLFLISNMHRIDRSADFVAGIEGIRIRNGSYSALVFPEDMDLSLDNNDILGRVCLDAGLLSGCWRQPETEVWAFTVQIFEEKR